MMESIMNFYKVIILFVLCNSVLFANAEVEELSEDNWTAMMEGEWLVKFYAPWCPACKSLAPTWDQLGHQAADLGLRLAKIDVTENPVLSGRFFITALPTIYHVKDGEFRQYKGHRSNQELISFIRDELWKNVEAVPWYWSPTSTHMAAVGLFFQFSIAIRNVHNEMTTEYGIPVWGSYVIFAVATILLGLLIGLVIVCLCDAINVSRHRRYVAAKSAKLRQQLESSEAAGGGDGLQQQEHSGVDTNTDDDNDEEGDFDLREEDDSEQDGQEDEKELKDTEAEATKDTEADAAELAAGDSGQLAGDTESTLRHRDATKPSTD